MIGHKSDVWSGCVTMMNALIGKEVNDVPDTQVCNNKYVCMCTISLFKVIRLCYV